MKLSDLSMDAYVAVRWRWDKRCFEVMKKRSFLTASRGLPKDHYTIWAVRFENGIAKRGEKVEVNGRT